mgnify:CR=1 FL=1
MTAFVPTNVISITDGQIFLETDLFNSGIRPAMNAGISVSRVGGAAQTKRHQEAGRRHPARARAVTASSRRSRSSPPTSTRRPARTLERGQRVTELMKQKQYAPMSVAEQALSIYAVNNGYMDKVEKKKIVDVRRGACRPMRRRSTRAS